MAGTERSPADAAMVMVDLNEDGKDKDSKGKKDKDKDKEPLVPFSSLFRYATPRQRALLFLSFLLACVHGASWPVWTVYFSDAIAQFTNTSIASGELEDNMIEIALAFVIGGLIVSTATGLHIFILRSIGVQQTCRMRSEFVKSVMRQDMAWLENMSGASLDLRLASNVPKIQVAISDVLGEFINQLSQGFIGLAIAFYFDWEMTLVMIAFSPILMVSIGIFAHIFASFDARRTKIYESAGTVADETFSLIRTVMAFMRFDYEERRYHGELQKARSAGQRAGMLMGFANALPDCAVFGMYAFAFWYGAREVAQRRGDDGETDFDIGDILTVMFMVMLCFMGLGQAAAQTQRLKAGQAAGAAIFSVIDRKSELDALEDVGIKPEQLHTLKFENVNFSYPSKPDYQILKDISFSVSRGESLALVGSSGSGKSTVAALIKRLYKPTGGSILINDRDIGDYSLPGLHKKIGLVSQTPVLLPLTIYENIALGKENATREQVIAAAKAANAHNFIMEFPDNYDTLVGDLGGQLSGGQRQRISIARTLISEPDILLLDEATSALDNTSEAMILDALARVSSKCCVISIAHRLSTVRDYNHILVFDHGRIVERGTHEELEALGGVYHTMLAGQNILSRKESQFSTLDTDADQDDAKAVKAGAGSKKDDSEDDKADKEIPAGLTGWVWQQTKPFAGRFFLSILGSVLAGGIWPASSIILTEAITSILNDEPASETNTWVFAFLGMVGYNLVAHWIRGTLQFNAGEAVTLHVRSQLYHKMLRQSCSWFDDERHARGTLMLHLGVSAAKVREVLIDSGSIMVLCLCTIMGGVAIAIVYCWRVALVILATIPVLVGAGVVLSVLVEGSDKEATAAFKDSQTMATRGITNTRLFTVLGMSQYVVDEYAKALIPGTQRLIRQAIKIGVVTFLTTFGQFGSFALSFWWGSVVVQDDYCSFSDFFKALSGVLFCGIMAGIYGGQMPNLAEARRGAQAVRQLFSEFENTDESGGGKITSIGDEPPRIQLQHVNFSYPTRAETQILRDFSLDIEPGTTVALVGASGSGKSTVVALAQQLYAAQSGTMLVAGHPVEQIDTRALRASIAVVEQQPKLFNTTIAENIAYSIAGEGPYLQEEIEQAARVANAHDFITELPEGYNTVVGAMGGRLSGGQQQRVAIARALFRGEQRVKIMLLDEFTAALDNESQRLVQEALNKASANRTTIIIAHRLTTIRQADCICVIQDGHVIESGRHRELMEAKGVYASMYDNEGQDDEKKPHSGSNTPPSPRAPTDDSQAPADGSQAPAGADTSNGRTVVSV